MKSMLHRKFKIPAFRSLLLWAKIDNENFIVDLATMPHLLMARRQGVSQLGINAILVSLLYKKTSSQLKFVLVDPKGGTGITVIFLIISFSKLTNEEDAIITGILKKVINTLNALCIEMDNLYDLLKGWLPKYKRIQQQIYFPQTESRKGTPVPAFLIVLVIDGVCRPDYNRRRKSESHCKGFTTTVLPGAVGFT